MAIEYLTGLNAIVMKAIWNIEKRQGRVTIQDLVEEIKRNTGKEYHRNSVSTYLRRLEKKDFIKENKRWFCEHSENRRQIVKDTCCAEIAKPFKVACCQHDYRDRILQHT